MRKTLAVVIVAGLATGCGSLNSGIDPGNIGFDASKIIAMERAALDRWGHGDPEGYLEIMSPDVTYFDPGQDKRIDGIAAMRAMTAQIAGKIRVDRYEMIDPKVQHYGDTAVMTYNLVNFQKQPDGSERQARRWNSTEVYTRVADQWRLAHSHWSFVRGTPPP